MDDNIRGWQKHYSMSDRIGRKKKIRQVELFADTDNRSGLLTLPNSATRSLFSAHLTILIAECRDRVSVGARVTSSLRSRKVGKKKEKESE